MFSYFDKSSTSDGWMDGLLDRSIDRQTQRQTEDHSICISIVYTVHGKSWTSHLEYWQVSLPSTHENK